MASLNKVSLIGNLGKDVEIIYAGETKIGKFSVATTESFKKGENWEEKTEWHNIVCFNKIAERAERLLQKGTTVYLEGKISTSMWETDAGEKRYKTEIIANNIQVIKGKKEQAETPPNDTAGDDLPY